MLYPAPGRDGSKATVTVTLASGQVVTGRLPTATSSRSALTDSNGWYRAWPTRQVKFVVNDPLQAHVDQLGKYTDGDMHDVLAYLQTLALKVRGCEGARCVASLGSCSCVGTPLLAQSLDPSALLKPTADSWPTYHGDYTRTATQQADADHAGERPSAHARVGVSDESAPVDQGDADPRERRHLPLDAR